MCVQVPAYGGRECLAGGSGFGSASARRFLLSVTLAEGGVQASAGRGSLAGGVGVGDASARRFLWVATWVGGEITLATAGNISSGVVWGVAACTVTRGRLFGVKTESTLRLALDRRAVREMLTGVSGWPWAFWTRGGRRD
jgi:hypothetical protein